MRWRAAPRANAWTGRRGGQEVRRLPVAGRTGGARMSCRTPDIMIGASGRIVTFPFPHRKMKEFATDISNGRTTLSFLMGSNRATNARCACLPLLHVSLQKKTALLIGIILLTPVSNISSNALQLLVHAVDNK